MATLNKLTPTLHSYANSVAGYVTSDNEAMEFIQGLEDHYEPHSVQYDYVKDGFVVTRTLEFSNFIDAVRKAKELANTSIGRPIVTERDLHDQKESHT
jgi:hypothetical protein